MAQVATMAALSSYERSQVAVEDVYSGDDAKAMRLRAYKKETGPQKDMTITELTEPLHIDIITIIHLIHHIIIYTYI